MNLLYVYSKLLKKIRGKSLKNCSIHMTSKVEAGSQLLNVTINRHSFCGYDCEISFCTIGSFCSIANRVVIGGGMHPTDWVGMSPVFYEGRDSVKAKFSVHKRKDTKMTVIGNDVWIGYGAMIKQGVIIGNGAVIGMGAIVTKDVEPYSIVGGNPAKLIRYRFDKDITTALQASEWWNYSDEKLYQCTRYFTNPKIFIEKILK